MLSTPGKSKGEERQTVDTELGEEESKEGEQYRFNLFVHLIFKDLVLFVAAFQLGSYLIGL